MGPPGPGISISRPGSIRRGQSLGPLLLWAHGPAILVLLGILLLARARDLHLPDLTRDPAAVMKAPVHIGVLSNAGIVVWSAAASLCFFTCFVEASRGRTDARRFILCSGLLTTALLLDDLFLLHERVLPGLGVPEGVVYCLHGTAVLAYLIGFGKSISASGGALLFLALGWFGLSMGMDLIPYHSPGMFFLEDAFKFLGISTWATYLARACFLECSAPAGAPIPRRRVEARV